MIPGQASASVERPKAPKPQADNIYAVTVRRADNGFIVESMTDGPGKRHEPKVASTAEEAMKLGIETLVGGAPAENPAEDTAPAERDGVRYEESVAPAAATMPAFAEQG